MSGALVILQPAASLCDTCPKPGACCSNFWLLSTGAGGWFPRKSWRRDALREVQSHGVPFLPHRYPGPTGVDRKRGLVAVQYSCPKLTSEGRCSIYATRPQTCRDYEPASDSLCVLYVAKAGEPLENKYPKNVPKNDRAR